eukprot:g6878.t1
MYCYYYTFNFCTWIIFIFAVVSNAYADTVTNTNRSEVTLKILRTVRASIISPPLAISEGLFLANTSYQVEVSIRKTFLDVNVTLLGSSYYSVKVPIRIDNTEYAVELRLQNNNDLRAHESVWQSNKVVLENLCNKVGVYDASSRRRMTENAQSFVNLVLEHILLPSDAVSNICLNVRNIHGYSRVNATATSCEEKKMKFMLQERYDNTYRSSHRNEVVCDSVYFSLSIAKQGAYELEASFVPSPLVSPRISNIVYINSNTRNILTVVGQHTAQYYNSNEVSTVDICNAAYIEVIQPKMLSTITAVNDAGRGNIRIIANCKVITAGVGKNGNQYKNLNVGHMCLNMNGENREIFCLSCYDLNHRENGLLVNLPLDSSNDEGNLSIQFNFWWSYHDVNLQNNLFECQSVQTRRQVYVDKERAIGKEENDVNKNDLNITIVTGVTASYFKQLKNLVGSIHVWESSVNIYVYDLGLKREHITEILKWERCFLRSLTQTDVTVPRHIFDISTYAFKMYIIQDMLMHFENVFYIDAGTVLLRPLDLVRATLHDHGYFFAPQTSRAFPWPDKNFHHPDTLKFGNCTSENEYYQKGELMTACVGTLQGWRNNSWLKKMLFEPLLKCSSNLLCIAPFGSNRANHLQDQTALNSFLCGKGLDICSNKNLSSWEHIWDGRRMVVYPESFLSATYQKYTFRRYDNVAMDFYDTGIRYKKMLVLNKTKSQKN